MRLPVAAHQRPAYGDDADAVVRAVIGLTAAVGSLATVMVAATGDVPLIGLPTLALLGSLMTGASVAGAAWSGAAVWLVLVPVAQGEALLAPLAMVIGCVAIALGPDRLISWLERDAAPASGPLGGHEQAAAEGWIEEMEGDRIG